MFASVGDAVPVTSFACIGTGFASLVLWTHDASQFSPGEVFFVGSLVEAAFGGSFLMAVGETTQVVQ